MCRGGVGFGEMEVVSQLQGVLRMCRGGVGLWGNGGGVTATKGCVGVGLGSGKWRWCHSYRGC